jgi:hypothetical protein
VLVSGAVDAWRYRDPAASSFDLFWKRWIVNMAERSADRVELSLENSIVQPGARMRFDALLLGARTTAANVGASVTVSAALIGPDGSRSPLEVWPGSRVGEVVGSARAPANSGVYRIEVSDGAATASSPVVIQKDLRLPVPDHADAMHALARSRGGEVVKADVDAVSGALARVVTPAIHATIGHPMRSPWWLAAFAAALGFEWWWRRRNSLP